MCEKTFLRNCLLSLVTWLSAALSCLQLLFINLHTFPWPGLRTKKWRGYKEKKNNVNGLTRMNYSLYRTLKASPVGRCASRSAVSIKYPILSLCILPRELLSASRNPSGIPSSLHSPQHTIPRSNFVHAMRWKSGRVAAKTDNFPTGDILRTFPSPFQSTAGDLISPALPNRCNMVAGGGNRKE